MNRETAGQGEKSSHRAAHRQGGEEPAHEEHTTREKWDSSWERVALGVAAAAGSGLLAAATIGVGPAALAGAAGYAAYRALREKRETAGASVKH
jgi:hypothetical protein